MRRVLLCLLALCPSMGEAQTYSYTQYRTAQGLPADKVNAVTRDRIGFLWVATDNGLARYDGRSFTAYQASLESRYIRDLVRRPDGDLLLANDAGVFAVTPRTDTATVRRLIGAHPRPTDSTVVYPNGVYEDARGRLWISQPNGAVARWHDGRLRSFPFGEDHATGASDSDFSFAEDGEGRLWLAARTGQLYRYARDAERFERVRPPQPPTQVHDLRAQGDTLWVVGDRLVQAQIGTEGTLADVRTHATGGRRLTHMTAGPEGFLFGTRQSGLFRGTTERTGLQLREVFGGNDPHRIEELPFRAIHHVYVDRDGSIWLGSRQGLGLLQSRFFSGVAGMPSNNTLAVHPGDDRVLLSFGEVYSVRPGEERDFVARPLPVSREQFVASIASTGDRLWMGTADSLLTARTDGRVTQRIDLTDRGGGIFYMFGDHRGDLWLCQAPADAPLKGVTRVRPDGTTKFYDADDGVENRILVLREGPRNALYAAGIGPTTYLFRYQPDRDRFINLSQPLPFDHSRGFEVHDLAIGERGLVWMATTDGLLRYDLERVQRVDLGPHTGTEIRSVETAPDGSIWLATDTDGLLHYREGTWVQFGQDTGLPTTVTVYRTLRTDARGRLWLGTAEGAVHSRRRRPTPASPDTAQVQVGVHPFPPFVIEAEDGEFTGLCVDLWEDLAAEMDVYYEYVRYTDPIGMVRALDYREIDLAINPLYVSSVRLNMFEVSQPFFISSVGVSTTTIARSQFQTLVQNLFSPDFLKIVLLLFGILLVFGTLLWAVERKENQFQFRPGLRGLLDGLWWAAVTMTTVGYGDRTPKTQAGRTIAIVWMFAAVVIVSGFTATIASTLTVNSLAAEIKQLEDLRSVERIGTVNATSSEDFLVSHDLLPSHEYETPRAALQALARQEVDVVVYDRTVMRYLINREKLDGSVELLPVTFNQQYRSFLMPRGSDLRRRLDPLLVRRINQADWQEVLRKYNLEASN